MGLVAGLGLAATEAARGDGLTTLAELLQYPNFLGETKRSHPLSPCLLIDSH